MFENRESVCSNFNIGTNDKNLNSILLFDREENDNSFSSDDGFLYSIWKNFDSKRNENSPEEFKSFLNENYALKINQKSNFNNYNKKIFTIKKMHKAKELFSTKYFQKKGRNKKHSGILCKHNKFSTDNIIKKFKVHFINDIYKYINSKFIVNKKNILDGKKKIKQIIKKINVRQSYEISQKKFKEWLNKKIKDVFEVNLSEKIKVKNKNYNFKIINKIYKENKEKDVIEFLEKRVRDVMRIYLGEENSDNEDGLKKMKDYVNYLKNKGETDEYINKFKTTVNNNLIWLLNNK